MSLHESKADDHIYAHFWFLLMGMVLVSIIGSAMTLAAVVTYWGNALVKAVAGPPR